MDTSSISHHISRQYNQELEDVRNRVLAMGGLVEQQIKDAVQALISSDLELAEQVITRDIQVNALEVGIDEECTQILARRQPAGSDLRLLVAVIKTITDLERIGDEAEKVARMAIHLTQLERPRNQYIEIQSLGGRVRQIAREALDTFARMDTEAAARVAQTDQQIDLEYEGILRQMMTHMMEDPRTIQRNMDIIWAARALERIGDHSRNICEYVIYLVKGKDVRHTSLAQIGEVAKRS
ncbi:MAG: phosphate signaling complex protein PhoU [Gammaproteobacteria bacterium]|nr:phosphate signaling complex protein PhoU [Gammaproteobacteria bacterium]